MCGIKILLQDLVLKMQGGLMHMGGIVEHYGTYIHRVLAILILLSSWGVLQSGLWTCSFTVQQAT